MMKYFMLFISMEVFIAVVVVAVRITTLSVLPSLPERGRG
jgi:hypothetical protein